LHSRNDVLWQRLTYRIKILNAILLSTHLPLSIRLSVLREKFVPLLLISFQRYRVARASSLSLALCGCSGEFNSILFEAERLRCHLRLLSLCTRWVARGGCLCVTWIPYLNAAVAGETSLACPFREAATPGRGKTGGGWVSRVARGSRPRKINATSSRALSDAAISRLDRAP